MRPRSLRCVDHTALFFFFCLNTDIIVNTYWTGLKIFLLNIPRAVSSYLDDAAGVAQPHSE